MRRLLMAAIAAMVVAVGAVPAQADHETSFDAYQSNPGSTWLGGKWAPNVNRDYCYDGTGVIPDPSETNLKSTTNEQINTEWEAETDITTNWVSIGDCQNDLSFSGYYYPNNGSHEDFCADVHADYPSLVSRIDYGNLTSGDDGVTVACDMDHNGNIDFFWLTVNDCFYRENECGGIAEPLEFHFGGKGTNVPSLKYDWAGMVTHEFGHATGFEDDGGHFDTAGMCRWLVGGEGTHETMCAGLWGPFGMKNDNGYAGSAWRTLGVHDIGEVNQAYP